MVSVVPAANKGSTSRREMPKAFSDIPTQKELDRAQRAKKSMAVWVVLLVLLLAGTGGFVAWELLVGRQAYAAGMTTKKDKTEDAAAKLIVAEQKLREKQKAFEQLDAAYMPFKEIGAAESQLANLRRSIDEELKVFPNGRKLTEVTHDKAWAVHKAPGAWKGTTSAEVALDLKAKSVLLEALLKEIKRQMLAQGLQPVSRPTSGCANAAGC